MDLGFGPDEGSGGLVVVGDEGVDVGDALFDAGERGAVERVRGQDGEPDFDLALARRRGSACRGNARSCGA